MSDRTAILWPMCAQAGLVALVWLRLYAVRLTEIRARRIDPQQLARADEAAKLLANNSAADNLRNLFEIPVLFFAICLALYVTGFVTPTAGVARLGLRDAARCAQLRAHDLQPCDAPLPGVRRQHGPRVRDVGAVRNGPSALGRLSVSWKGETRVNPGLAAHRLRSPVSGWQPGGSSATRPIFRLLCQEPCCARSRCGSASRRRSARPAASSSSRRWTRTRVRFRSPCDQLLRAPQRRSTSPLRKPNWPIPRPRLRWIPPRPAPRPRPADGSRRRSRR